MDFEAVFKKYKEGSIAGRYITNNHIEPLLKKLSDDFKVGIIGQSVKEKPIYSVRFGNGEKKIFMWSQMHGNESTTTKALFDLFNFLSSNEEDAKIIKESFTLLIIPILNPDGAEAYTRVNANEVDLNRDSVDLSQPEAQLLRKAFEDFKPDYCFNLHDQRTIFAAGETRNPATVSFLSPAYDEEREYNDCRLKAVDVIVAMNDELQKHIPNQIGRFDDSFNLNCIGDRFQSLGVPTILFEAGHYQDDYQREETRKYIFISYLTALKSICSNVVVERDLESYLNIPQNKSLFFDFLYKNIKIKTNSLDIISNFAAHYREILVDGKVNFEAYIVETGDSITNFGHVEFDGKGGIYSDKLNNIPEINKKADFSININIEFVNGIRKNL
ncbi:M14 metallopeptidase family protein [Flavobacterium sp. H122]|uniref:M14 family metallopeptidase n=1 Tax=Flavobacterium sp. H122 TaxID=2529860 RepID=UPI0010AAFC22|nr:M14 metallopeptidase family protein [Flavobacterium sp. H122]